MAEPPFVWFSGPLGILGEDRRRALLARGRRLLMEARVQVTPLMYDVRDNGDEALRRLTQRFDGVDVERLTIDDWEWREQAGRVPAKDRKALEAAAKRIKAYHAKQVPKAWKAKVDGVELGWKPVPLDRVGIYVPGGQASYPSTLLMAAIPAKLAGVKQVVACTPPRKDGSLDPLLLVAADVAGVDEVYRVGGAQAVFAMAFGTKSVPRCDLVVGPGNVYVQAAKQLVQGTAGIDLLAGPSEVLVIADESAPPGLVAWELAAQAEHDANAVSVLVATSDQSRRAVEAELRELVPKLDRAETVKRSFSNHAHLMTASLSEALAFANEFGPEHLVLMVRDPQAALAKVRHAGSVFLGTHAPVALGDYGAGTNHILPTSGTARFSSGLGVGHFVHGVQWQDVSPQALARLAPDVQHLATLEGLTAHAGAVGARTAKRKAGAKGKAKKR